MNLKTLFGFDLAGKLKKWKRNYHKSKYVFDHKNVVCGVTEWSKPEISYTVSASVYCNDPHIDGFDIRSIAWIYQSKKFYSRIEAEAHLEMEIRRATKRHPQSRFYRETSRIKQNAAPYEYCENGKWYECNELPPIQRCNVCGLPIVDENICPNCGEPYLGF